jgi:nucleotidyltransferase substrate binding protein (TIGR01987 family)
MHLDVNHLIRTTETLRQALQALETEATDPTTVRFDLFRNAAIKSFEISLETAGKLLRRTLKAYVAAPREIDSLVFNEVLRLAGRHGLLSSDETERWLRYRANRNTTAHDYGEGFANETLKLLPVFLADAVSLAERLRNRFPDGPPAV